MRFDQFGTVQSAGPLRESEPFNRRASDYFSSATVRHSARSCAMVTGGFGLLGPGCSASSANKRPQLNRRRRLIGRFVSRPASALRGRGHPYRSFRPS